MLHYIFMNLLCSVEINFYKLRPKTLCKIINCPNSTFLQDKDSINIGGIAPKPNAVYQWTVKVVIWSSGFCLFCGAHCTAQPARELIYLSTHCNLVVTTIVNALYFTKLDESPEYWGRNKTITAYRERVVNHKNRRHQLWPSRSCKNARPDNISGNKCWICPLVNDAILIA